MAFKSFLEADFFHCTRCGVCCQGYGGTYVGSRDLEAIAAYLKMPLERARQDFCVLSGDKLVLSQRADGFCFFWDKMCTIHPVKPLMCRRWPFIPSLLVDPGNWQIMADSCPGIRRDVDPQALLLFTRTLIGCSDRPLPGPRKGRS